MLPVDASSWKKSNDERPKSGESGNHGIGISSVTSRWLLSFTAASEGEGGEVIPLERGRFARDV
jgi:hypothetical protein